MKEKLKGFFSVFIVLMLLPYVCTILFTGSMDREIKTNKSDGATVMVQYNGNIYEMELEEYLIGIVPMAMSIEYEKEALMAQAILMRTNIRKQLADAKVSGEEVIFDEEFVTYEELREIMPESELMIHYVKLEEAIQETKGIVAHYNNNLVELPYHSMSAGMTRVGEEVFHSIDYGYIPGADSEKDIEGINYLSMKTFTIEDIILKCKTQYPDIVVSGVNNHEDESETGDVITDVITVEEVPLNGADTPAVPEETEMPEEISVPEETEANPEWASQIVVINQDSAGYALQIQIGNTVIPAEKFRTLLNLNSSHLSFSMKENRVTIMTKGIGHGVGLSQYGANEMAKSGSGWEEILNHYFSGLEFLEQ